MTSADQVPGKIDGSLDFDGSNDEVRRTNAIIGDSVAWTITAWIKMGADIADQRTIYSEGDTTVTEYLFLYVDDAGSQVKFYSESGSNFASISSGTTPVEDDQPHYVAMVQRSKIDRELYVDTVSQGSDTQNAGTLTFNTASIGYLRTDWVADPFKGIIDEVRISNIDRSADWLSTSFNTQDSPSTFYSVGAEVTAGGTVCPAPSTLFSDGFESGNLTAWDGSNTETGDTLAASTEQAKTGTYSAKAVLDTVTGAQAMVWKNIAGQTTLYSRTYFYLDPSFVTTGDITVMAFSQSDWTSIISIHINDDMTMYLWNSVAGEAYGFQATNTISKGAWHSLEMMATISPTAGEARLWLDNNLEIEATAKNLGTAITIDRVATAITWASPKTEANTLYIDDSTLCLEQMASSGGSILLVTPDASNLTAQDAAKKALIESWGYAVVPISASDTQANFDAAVATSAAAYVSEEITSTDLGTKLRGATIGIVIGEDALTDEFGISSTFASYSSASVDITDNTHYITSSFSAGSLTITTSAQPLHTVSGTIAGGVQVLAEQPATTNGTLVVIETGGALHDVGTAAGRRVYFPWAGGAFDINSLNANGQLLMRKAIEWATGAGAAAPAQVTGLSATPVATQIDLSWTAPADNGSPITGYKIERRIGAGSWATLVADTGTTATTYSDTTVSGGTQYGYRVSAINGGGTGPASTEATATADDVPAQVTGLSATAVSTRIDLAWTAPSDGGDPITGYKIERRIGAGTWAPLVADTGTTATTHSDTTVFPGTQYGYRVSAINGVGAGPVSLEATATANDVPAQVTGLSATAVGSQIDLAWTAPSD
ncbi:MAG: LamG-like jellyroll fold domain-containing protein, partial [Acidimicrobiia bacterium]